MRKSKADTLLEEAVRASTTIIATMFQERGIMPGQKLAGLMAAELLFRHLRGEPCTSALAPWVLVEKESS